MKKQIVLAVTLACLALTSCVQETHTKNISVEVDMTNVENVADVGIRGNFTSPPWNKTLLLKDPDGDGIYAGSFTRQAANGNISFKFVNQSDLYELQGQNNRSLQFEYKPETITCKAVFDNPETMIIKE